MPIRLAAADEVSAAPGAELLRVSVDGVAVKNVPSKSVLGKETPKVGLPAIVGPLKSGRARPQGNTVAGIELPLCVP
jgi:hypothetical protein